MVRLLHSLVKSGVWWSLVKSGVFMVRLCHSLGSNFTVFWWLPRDLGNDFLVLGRICHDMGNNTMLLWGLYHGMSSDIILLYKLGYYLDKGFMYLSSCGMFALQSHGFMQTLSSLWKAEQIVLNILVYSSKGELTSSIYHYPLYGTFSESPWKLISYFIKHSTELA